MRNLAFVALVGYVCSYSFSFGPITWVILSEIFPASTKGRAMALATAFNWLGNIIVSLTFLEATGLFKIYREMVKC
jgi:MFS family permease